MSAISISDILSSADSGSVSPMHAYMCMLATRTHCVKAELSTTAAIFYALSAHVNDFSRWSKNSCFLIPLFIADMVLQKEINEFKSVNSAPEKRQIGTVRDTIHGKAQ